MEKGVVIGILVGCLLSFVDSYTYAISGYTTAEISLVIIPFLVASLLKLVKTNYSSHDLITATAIAYGMCITTTLASGMYITFGFLDYVSRRLKAYGLEISVPKYLFSNFFPDFVALPTYIALALASFSGALIAFTFRNHFIEKERLKYPIGLASAILIKLLQKISISLKTIVLIIISGFILQFIAMRINTMIDLTSIVSSIAPGAVLAFSFWPIVIGLLFLIPLDPLRNISIGSISTYLLFIPLSVVLFKVKVVPAINYEEALYSYSPILIGLNVGTVLTISLLYLLIYSRTLYISLLMVLKLKMEKLVFVLSLIMFLLIGFTSLILVDISLFLYILPMVFIHMILTIVNLRIVGETGTSSQVLLPLATMYMYVSGARNVGIYATLDPYTGIPMPQLVGGASMNLLRLSRFFKYSVVKTLFYFGIGMFLGSFATYVYGNMLVNVYGFESNSMPLTRWIPVVLWMASIYSGKLNLASVYVIILGIFIGLILAVIGLRKNISLFPFVVGMTMPPDIGIVSLIVYMIKIIMIKLGVEVHEKMIVFAILFLIGCGTAVIFNTIMHIATAQ